MHQFSRRAVLGGLGGLGVAGLLPSAGRAAPLLDSLTIAGMPATPSVVLAHMVESDALAGHVGKARLKLWRTPDQVRAGVVSGEMKVFGIPAYSCANLKNRGAPVRMLNIMTWGLLYVMSRDPSITRIEDLAGRTILQSFRGDAPDLVFRQILRKLGMNADKDVTLNYVATPTEAGQLFLAGKADVAILQEPMATAIQMRGMQAGISVHRVLDLTEIYGKVNNRKAGIPQAGLGVSEELIQQRPELVRAIHQSCVASARWVGNNPASAGRLGTDYLDLPGPIIERSLPHFRLGVVSAAESRAEMEAFFGDLLEMSPDILGGKLPEGGFYWGV
ncbi:ABC-type sulfonate transport system periplasmic component [Paramagnetospirillum caucaseum]|uniref:ABC-type sulfonate transport system periplasmic component n=1 Tax=Paramagnetospirillum caucaseum TaxID=1244869 RepID=M2Z2J4_9PROT|nr:ABC transporter substrate-binding protein [Paramagnetospirillum caucaseum]EME68535.1 ABC-type sulfonate transport system periplasmic component [Paramagnetospirillum caucaseum]